MIILIIFAGIIMILLAHISDQLRGISKQLPKAEVIKWDDRELPPNTPEYMG